MTRRRPAKWSAVFLVVASVSLAAQDGSLKQLFESGKNDEVVQRAAGGRASAPEDVYLAALAHLKMGNADGARGEFQRLCEREEEVWRQIGASGVAVAGNNGGEAVTAARRAVEVSGDHPFAHYQLGLAASTANDWGTSAAAFARSAEIKTDFAYAHYNAGLAYQKDNNLGRAADFYGYFVKLAPDAPERGAVLGILRTLRK
jgi:tetratricopeptide (TPR) repeat protein